MHQLSVNQVILVCQECISPKGQFSSYTHKYTWTIVSSIQNSAFMIMFSSFMHVKTICVVGIAQQTQLTSWDAYSWDSRRNVISKH